MNRWMFMLMALLLAGMGSKGYAQESSAGEQKEKEPRHSISIILSHAILRKAVMKQEIKRIYYCPHGELIIITGLQKNGK